MRDTPGVKALDQRQGPGEESLGIGQLVDRQRVRVDVLEYEVAVLEESLELKVPLGVRTRLLVGSP